MALRWLLLLVLALPPITTGIKVCEFCDMIESSTCTGISMPCADDEQCFTSYGIIPGLGPIINKGCRLSSSCGHLQESVLYKHATYKLSSSCCKGELCNRVYIFSGSLKLGATTCLVLGMLLLLY
ncbi:sperm acrosome membrane-associated protein 4-like [Eptesicus fuscus]|uniref:sperm acrosome membrane-associated protein 4-like n=1 Tax=Eptesicus fuscus TaxID=29078 RepID=UPI0024044129|nr:sperm acrosome membrane-associated protein 4-like [Eptesicus fuscus]